MIKIYDNQIIKIYNSKFYFCILPISKIVVLSSWASNTDFKSQMQEDNIGNFILVPKLSNLNANKIILAFNLIWI